MDQPRAVDGVEAARDGRADTRRFGGREAPVRQDRVAQVGTVDVLHDEDCPAAVLHDVVGADHRVVLDRAGRHGRRPEPVDRARIPTQLG